MSQVKRASKRPRVTPLTDPHVRKSDRTRTAILDAALEFLWSRPFRELTVAELMSIPGVSRSAFYRYFHDLHNLMEALLDDLADAILDAAAPWFTGDGDPLPLLRESLAGLVSVSYERGPILRSVADAAATDQRLEGAWSAFLDGFDDTVAARIEQHQEQGLIPDFDARPVAVALNRLDASLLIHAFGRRPRRDPEPIEEALVRIWMSTLYPRGAEVRPRTTP
jgi:AcrR family transcriptional regulator